MNEEYAESFADLRKYCRLGPTQNGKTETEF